MIQLIKCGSVVTVCANFLKLLLRISFNNIARIIGIGSMIKPTAEKINVFFSTRSVLLLLKIISKYFNPTNLFAKIGYPGLYSNRERIQPNNGTYWNSMTSSTNGNAI